MRQSTMSKIAAVLAVTLAALTLVALVLNVRATSASEDAVRKRDVSLAAANAVRDSSALLTNTVRAFTATTNTSWLDMYWTEIEVTQTQPKALASLREAQTPQAELDLVAEASKLSGILVEAETRAMRLVLDAKGVDAGAMPKAVAGWKVSPEDQALKPASKLDLARELVHGPGYAAEVQKIMAPLATFRQQLTARVTDAVNSAEKQRLTAVVLLGGSSIALIAALLTFIYISNRQVGRVLVRYADTLRSRDPRDLSVRLEPRGVSELREMAQAYNAQSEQVAQAIEAIGQNAVAVAAASEELSAVSQQVEGSAQQSATAAAKASTAATEASSNTETVAAATEEMTTSIREISKSANDAAGVAGQAVRVAEATNAAVAKLGESSIEIGNVIKVITSIAEQTNLLALNATIEAARAGEAGKGFAVVANEVKDLAQETAKATEDISHRVEQIQVDTEAAAAAISQISAIIAQINDTQSTIASAVEEQTGTTNDMSRNVTEAARGSQSIAGNVVQVAGAAKGNTEQSAANVTKTEELQQQASQLQELVAHFRV